MENFKKRNVGIIARKLKAKSIGGKLLINIITLTLISVLTIGAISAYLNYETAVSTLDRTMVETVKLANKRISLELDLYKNMAIEAGMDKVLSDPNTTVSEKQNIIGNNVIQYGLQRGNILELNGKSIFDSNDYSDRDYFKESVKGNSYASDPIVSKITGKLSIIISAPIWKDGIPNSSVIGVIYFVPNEQFLNDIVRSIKIGESGNAFILNKDGLTIAHINEELVGVDNVIESAKTNKKLSELAEIHKKMIDGEQGFGNYKYGGIVKFNAYAPIEKTNGWSIGITANQSEFLGGFYNSIVAIIISVVVFILLGFIAATKIAKDISKPIIHCSERMRKLSEGDLTTEVIYDGREDEIGVLTKSLGDTIKDLKEIINDIKYHLGEIEGGNLTTEVTKKYVGDFDSIENSLKGIIKSLNNNMSQIVESAEQITDGSEQIAEGAQSLSQGATEQASSIEELAATIEEMTEQISENAKNAEKAKEVSVEASRIVEQGNIQVNDMNEAMEIINEKSREIAKIIKVIDDIAFQTNILALNAAVEAARAGSAGKGFAVVAEEVRNLASKSAEAAKQTSELIENSIYAVDKGNMIASKTKETLEVIVDKVNSAVESIEEIAEYSRQQAVAASQVSVGIEQISAVVQTNSATAEESAAASEELSSQAHLLKEMTNKLKLK